MKKIGIMTWYQHKNYGTTLQAAALIHVIGNLGYEVKGIDYYSKGYDRETFLEKLLSFRRIKEGIYNLIYKKKYGTVEEAKKDLEFDEFIKLHIPMTEKSQTASQLYRLNDFFDAFVCGSDQIWTPNEFNSKYYLDFVADDSKKIAYAPSFGVSEINNPYAREAIGKYIKKINHLSVREEQAQNMINEYYGIQPEVVLDPTLLLKQDQWDSFSDNRCIVKERILLCYFLGKNENYWKYVDKIAKENNLIIYVIPVHAKDYIRHYKVLNGVGPAQFLSLIKQAELICTDSFHGTVFSINFNKKFISFDRFRDNDVKSQNSRLHSILKLLNLQHCLYNKKEVFPQEIQWEYVNQKLADLRKKSMCFLKDALRLATSVEYKDTKITNTCCGCGVCAVSCPKQAITMTLLDGFYKAEIDNSKCINCGLCIKICGFNGSIGSKIIE